MPSTNAICYFFDYLFILFITIVVVSNEYFYMNTSLSLSSISFYQSLSLFLRICPSFFLLVCLATPDAINRHLNKREPEVQTLIIKHWNYVETEQTKSSARYLISHTERNHTTVRQGWQIGGI